MPSAHISRRDYIRWSDDPSSEPTSTLVLTSKTGWYVDVRILRNPDANATELEANVYSADKSDAELLAEMERAKGHKHLASLQIDRLDWAFSGQGKSDPAWGNKPARSSWHHWVDSKTLLTEPAIEDAGDMYPQADGRTLEKGSMVNPATGRETEYEEMWRDIPIERPKSWKPTSQSCVVMVCDVPDKQVRGSAMRLGAFYQGVLRRGKGVLVERWQFVEDGKEEKWVLVARVREEKVGSGPVFPDPVLLGNDEFKSLVVGQITLVEGLEWFVKEAQNDW